VQVSDPNAVLLAAGITAFITLGLAAFALQTKYDFTTSNGILTGALLALMLAGIGAMFFPTVSWLQLAIAGGGAFLFSCFIIVDIQMLMDGALACSSSRAICCLCAQFAPAVVLPHDCNSCRRMVLDGSYLDRCVTVKPDLHVCVTVESRS
jgi:FtsH-binding integral membrane protein